MTASVNRRNTGKKLSCSDAVPPKLLFSCQVCALLELQRLCALARARGHRHVCMYVCTLPNVIGSTCNVFAFAFISHINNATSLLTSPLTQYTCIQSNMQVETTPRQTRVSMSNGCAQKKSSQALFQFAQRGCRDACCLRVDELLERVSNTKVSVRNHLRKVDGRNR